VRVVALVGLLVVELLLEFLDGLGVRWLLIGGLEGVDYVFRACLLLLRLFLDPIRQLARIQTTRHHAAAIATARLTTAAPGSFLSAAFVPTLFLAGGCVFLFVFELFGVVGGGEEGEHGVGLAADAAVVAAGAAAVEELVAGGAEVFNTILAVDQDRISTLFCLAFFADGYAEVAVAGELLAGLFFAARERGHGLFHVGGEFGVDVFVGELGAVAERFGLEDEVVLLGEV